MPDCQVCGGPLPPRQGRGAAFRVHPGECKKEHRRRIVYLSRMRALGREDYAHKWLEERWIPAYEKRLADA